MLISFFCPLCKSKLEIEADAIGTDVACPQCGKPVTVPRKPLGPGVTVGGFKIKQLIGRGAMGEVYLARQLSTERDIALKILPPRLTMEKDVVERFLKEVRTQARMEHPHIVQVHEAGEDSGVYYMAMAYVGGSLADRIERRGALHEHEALEIIHKLAGALAYAWEEHRLLHRDIKPSNILLDQHGDPRLTDLGLSKSLKEAAGTTLSDFVVGTPNYMSPEQAEGQVEIDFRSDIYSLGATLYHMLTARVPYEGHSVLDILRKQATEALPDPRDFNRDVSEACVELLTLMLAKERDNRHPSWAALMGDLERVMAGGRPNKEPLAPGESAVLRVQAMETGQDDQKLVHMRHSQIVRAHDRLMARTMGQGGGAGVGRLITGLALVILLAGLAAFLNLRPPPTPEPPTPSPVVSLLPTAPAEDPRLLLLARRFDEAVRHAEENPQDLAGSIKWFETVAKDGARTEYEIKAAAEVDKLSRELDQAVAGVMGELRDRGEQLFRDGRGGEAAATALAYTGPFARDTLGARESLAVEWGERVEAARRAEEEQQRAAQSAWTALLGDVADDLLKGNSESAIARADHAPAETALLSVQDDVAALEALLRKVAAAESVILNSFRKDQGQEVDVEFADGRQRLEIVSVSSGRVQARRNLGTAGYAQRAFRVRDLGLQEQYERIGSGSEPEYEIMRGLLLFRAQKASAAEKAFRRAGGALGEELASRTQVMAADAREAAAAAALAGLRRMAGLTAAAPAGDDLLRAIRRTAYSPGEVARIRDGVATFRRSYGDTREGAAAEPLLTALERVGTVPREIDPETLGKVIKRIEQANPQVTTLVYMHDVGDEGTELDLSKNAELTDIEPLRGLPLAKLILSETKVRDLGPLKGMPLVHLHAMNCPIEDISALEGMPLEDLNIAGCKVRSIRPLKGAPLKSLNLSGNQVDMITTLSDMPLKWLDLGTCPVLDIRPLRGLPLEWLSLWRTKISDLRALKGLPLKSLLLVATPVTDLGDLKGLPLEQLYISFTAVSNLSPLAGMPLKELHADQCRLVADLSPLEGMSLSALGIGMTSVTNLGVVKGMPLAALNITGTAIRDLSPLRGMKTLVRMTWDAWDHFGYMRDVREALRAGKYDVAVARLTDVMSSVEGVPALEPASARMRALAEEFIPSWRGPARDDPRSAARTFEGRAYALGPVVANVKAAQAYCAAHGAHLATVTSKQEMNWIAAQFGLFGLPVFLGGTDEKKEGVWQWMTGEPWSFANWPPQQPDNFKGIEHHLVFMMGGAWHDVSGDFAAPFLMEWDR